MLRFFWTHRRKPATYVELEERLEAVEITLTSILKRLRRFQSHLAAERSAEVRQARNTEEIPAGDGPSTEDFYNGRW